MVNEPVRRGSGLAKLEMKLKDTIELLHLWKGEAYAYRNLVEAVTSGRFSLEEARELLERQQAGTRLLGCPCFALGATQDPADRGVDCRLEVLLSREELLELGIVNEKCEIEGKAEGIPGFTIPHSLFTILTESELNAFLAVADRSGLSPAEFLWACVESMMNSSDDPDVLRGCREAAYRRFKAQVLSDWAGV